MELGWLLYFFVVFVLGGVLLLGLAAYFGWEVVTRRHRPAWSNRTRGAKVMIALSGLLFTWLLFIPLRMIWVTRVGAIQGSYTVLNFHAPMPSDATKAAAAIESFQIFSAGPNPGTMSISATKNRKRSVASTEETLYIDNRPLLLSD